MSYPTTGGPSVTITIHPHATAYSAGIGRFYPRMANPACCREKVCRRNGFFTECPITNHGDTDKHGSVPRVTGSSTSEIVIEVHHV